MSKKITLENVDSSELPEIPVIGEVKQIRFTQDMELVSTLADSDLFMIQAGADLEARPNTITFDLIIKNLSGPIEEGSKKFVTGDMMFKVIGDMNLLDTWDNTNLVNSLNATYVNVRRIEEELRREINRSTGKDEQHDEQIANLRQDLTSTNEMLNQEINRSVAKDKEHDELLEGLRDDVYSISSKLDAEIDRSTAKDAEHDTLLKGLRVDVNANKSAIESEVARSTARDEDHDAAISKNASDIATETSRAKAEEAKIRQEMKTADTNLQNAITAETERATGVEEDLQRQITDLSGSTDDRLEALEALSHEQNTDTGTTSKTFVIDSGNTGAMLKAEGGGLSTRTNGDAGYANFTVQNLVIKGDVTQEGDTFITQAERVEVRDNMILINEGETGAGVTAGFAGIEVDRGTEQNFMFGFNESDGMFKIGKEGNMFDVALRQPVGDMIDGMFASWDAATKTFKTTNVIPYNKSLDFKFDPEIVDATLKMKFMEAGLGLSMSGDDSILALLPGIPQDEVKYSLISTNTNGIILGDSSGSNDKFILDIKKPSFISPVLDKNVIIGGKNAYFSYYSHSWGSPNKITASCSVGAPSFYRESDRAEVLYAVDPSSLTDGMFLSWDATNKMVVTTNIVPKGQSVFFGNENSFITYGSTSLNSGSGSAIGFNLNMQFGNLLIYPSSGSGYLVFDGGLRGQGYGNGIKFNSPINVEKVNSTGKFLELSVGDTTSIKMEGSGVTIATPVLAPSYHRSSDDSEVLYQADLKSVLTGKETNYAPTVKAVSDAIDSVNTGTTESLKGYLKLSGGTMTGSIISNVNQILKYNYNSAPHSIISFVTDGPGYMSVGNYTSGMRVFLLTNDSDVLHYRSTDKLTGTSYRMWDTYNLPDPATKSGNNAFTGTNSFVANKFSVGSFKVDRNSSLEVNIPYKENVTAWERSLSFMYNSLEDTRVTFGSMISATAADYAYIGIGSVSYNNAQYKFRTESLDLNTIFRIDFGDASAISANKSTIIFGSNRRGCYVISNDTDLVHIKNSDSYKIWDASNLPTPASTSDIPDVSDMARRSEANTFTASNTFTAGQFNVGAFEIDANNNIFVNISQESGWARELVFINSSSATNSVRYGVSGSTKVANYAYIGIGDVDYDSAQYKFTPSRLIVPATWSLIDEATSGEIILFGSENQYFGRNRGTTYIRSGNTDLYHTKVSTSYKILDESNYSQYLPTTSKWTYGFVGVNVTNEVFDLNTDLQGSDKPKAVYSYTSTTLLSNAPSNSEYGSVWQLWNSGQTDAQSLNPQLFFDINHNVENGTRYMYFRTSNNKGFGDSSNWKRVLTADENVASLVMDKNTYPSIARIDGTTYMWLRAPTNGLLPNTPVTLADGGISYLGTSYWSFQRAYISNVYANNHYFGSSGTYLSGDANYAGVLNNGTAKGMKVGSLLVSSNYASTTLVPTNGIFSSGIIRSNDSMLVGYSENVTNGMLGYGLYYDGTFAQGLGSEYSSGALVLYKILNPNNGKAGYNVPRATTGIPTYLKITDGTVKLGVGVNKTYTAGEAVTVTEHTLATLDAVNTKLGSYLPLTGGTVSGSLSISPVGSSVFSVDNSDTGGTDVFQTFRVKGTSKFLLGWSESGGGPLIQRSGNNRSMILKSDGIYTGPTLGSTVRVATLTDLGEYLPLTGGTMSGSIICTANQMLKYTHNSGTHSAISVTKDNHGYISVGNYSSGMRVFLLTNDSDVLHYVSTNKVDGVNYRMWDERNLPSPATQSWVTSQGYLKSHQTIYALTFAAGAFAAKTFTPTSAAVTVNVPTKTSHLTNDSGFLTSVPSTYATQSWVTSQGYLTSITKSMVTTALGYTPPTTNTTYSQATSSTLGLVKIGATGLASKNYAVQLNSSGQMYVAVPWTDTDTNTHYTTRLYAGASGTAANSATTSPYIKVTDDNTYRNQIRLLGGGATSVSSDASGNITITSTNTTYSLATSSSNGLMSSSQYTKLSNCIETVSATDMVTSVQVVDTIPASSSQVTGRLYLKFA